MDAAAGAGAGAGAGVGASLQFADLTDGILGIVVQFLGPTSLCRLGATCKRLHSVTEAADQHWQRLCLLRWKGKVRLSARHALMSRVTKNLLWLAANRSPCRKKKGCCFHTPTSLTQMQRRRCQ